MAPPPFRCMLVEQGCIVREIEPVYLRENHTQFAMAYYVINFSELRIWELLEYSRTIYLDGEMQVFDYCSIHYTDGAELIDSMLEEEPGHDNVMNSLVIMCRKMGPAYDEFIRVVHRDLLDGRPPGIVRSFAHAILKILHNAELEDLEKKTEIKNSVTHISIDTFYQLLSLSKLINVTGTCQENGQVTRTRSEDHEEHDQLMFIPQIVQKNLMEHHSGGSGNDGESWSIGKIHDKSEDMRRYGAINEDGELPQDH